MPFGQRHVAISIYNICKGHFGSMGGGEQQKQTERHQFHLSNDKCHNFGYMSYACTEGTRQYLGNEVHSYRQHFRTFTFFKN